jgi:hypothetical protein
MTKDNSTGKPKDFYNRGQQMFDRLNLPDDDDDDTQVYKKPWVGLGWEDMPEEYAGDSNFLSGARWAEARLKERNT